MKSESGPKKNAAPTRKAPTGETQRKRVAKIVSSLPEAEAGSKAWVALWLDGPKLDWHAVELALRTAYEKTAARKLLRG